ncbi:hypothetical protein GCM10007938_26730 [Vibrio zhanjiangensis]|uniref:HTH cro/C1-type domain-containing protein n=1 Tax=Vibrio zhanjiangensis TaxID=1046128 RepID=A0ABQ6F0W5_9VIBR|nr:helix-turn-helix transcriptional regulator [Vibrio zhanjiangensis]GLT18891.1 hypothetical protein GCM10007938_26730 [Vibrio zhanjiangensis]
MKRERLILAREKAGLSREQVAEAMYKSPHTIKSWETTSRQPRSLKEIERLCDLLGINVHWYLSGQPPMKKLSKEQQDELLALFSELTDQQKEAILEVMRVITP